MVTSIPLEVRKSSRVIAATLPVIISLFLIMLAGFFSRDVFAGESPAVSGQASGTVTIDGNKLKLNHAYGMAQPNTFDKKKTDIAVLITEQPLPTDALSELEDLMDAVMKRHGWVFFKINEEGKPIYEVVDHPKLGKNRLMSSGLTMAGFTAKKMGKDRIDGTFQTKKAAEFMDHLYEIKVTFQTPVLQAKRPEPLLDAKTGSPLPSGGGEPGKAYKASLKAILAKDLAAFRKSLPPDKTDVSDDELKEGLDMLAQMTPRDMKITKGFIAGDRAALYVTGTSDGEMGYATVEMKRINGIWYAVKEEWSNTPPK